MKAADFVTEYISPGKINKAIDRSSWTRKGIGATATVWQRFDDPTTVVKVVGGGHDSGYHDLKSNKKLTLAFVQFCVEHGHESPHFPIIHGINVDDEDVLQVRIEALRPLPSHLGEDLGELSDYPRQFLRGKGYQPKEFQASLEKHKLTGKNSIQSLVNAVLLLKKYKTHYCRIHKLRSLFLDLHEGNWLLRTDGTIVAVDPWHGY